MDLELSGKTAIITGSSRGIGRAIALGLASEGCNIVLCARGEEALERTAREIGAVGVETLALSLDLAQRGEPERLVGEAHRRFGQIDVLVNSVGGNRRGEFAETTDEDWEEILELNLGVHARASRAAIPHMRRQAGGVIIFISSIFGREAGGPGLSIYNTTKAAVISLAKIMALELAPDGIRVNSVAPGSIRFPGGSWDRRCKEDPEGMKEFIARNLPLGRFGTDREVADVVTFLASERASLLTGACLNVDGGQSRSLI